VNFSCRPIPAIRCDENIHFLLSVVTILILLLHLVTIVKLWISNVNASNTTIAGLAFITSNKYLFQCISTNIIITIISGLFQINFYCSHYK